MQWDGTYASAELLFAAFGTKDFSMNTSSIKSAGLYVHTLEGAMRANAFDYIIKGIKGEYYPCKPEIFQATYEAVNE